MQTKWPIILKCRLLIVATAPCVNADVGWTLYDSETEKQKLFRGINERITAALLLWISSLWFILYLVVYHTCIVQCVQHNNVNCVRIRFVHHTVLFQHEFFWYFEWNALCGLFGYYSVLIHTMAAGDEQRHSVSVIGLEINTAWLPEIPLEYCTLFHCGIFHNALQALI